MINLFEKLLGSLKLFLNMFNKNQSINNSPGSTQIQGNKNVINQKNESIPEIEVWLPGNGAKETFEGYIKNHSKQSLVLEYVEINGVKTMFDQQFRKHIPIVGQKIIYPKQVFTNKIDNITIKVRYHTLAGNAYEYRQTGNQTSRADKKFNISFNINQHSPKHIQIK